MIKKTPLILLIAGLLTALAIIFSGCSTKNPWATNPNPSLVLSLVSGPSDSLSVPLGSGITFSWTYGGGKGLVQYQYKLDEADWSSQTQENLVTIHGAALGYHTLNVRGQDEVGGASEIATIFRVVEPSTPVVTITQSPGDSTFVAAGTSISFTWIGNDSTTGADYMLYQYSFEGVTSEWTPALTVTFNNLAVSDPAAFTVQAKDLGGNLSNVASITFAIKNATILYVDDYQWLDSFGNVDRAKEREQKQFYRAALNGYAFAEWDNDARRALPTMADLTGITTIVWAADANGCSADPTFRLYTEIGAVGGGVLKQFLDAGGHLLLTGNEALNYLFDTNPPDSTHFEAKYLGVSDTSIIVPPDSVPSPTWAASTDFTWAIKATGSTLSLPDSMKIDVAKNGSQLACDASLLVQRSGVIPLFTVGLDVDGAAPDDYGMVNGWLYMPPNQPFMSASLMYDTFSMPLPGIRQTFHTILEQFGEGHGL